MDMPLLCELDVRIKRKKETQDENIGYLQKILSDEMLDRTFKELVDYMVDNDTDELNQKPYNQKQKNLTNTIIGWYQEAARTPDKVKVDILPANLEPGQPIVPYDPNDVLRSHLHDMKKVKKADVDGQDIEYNCIDLILAKIGGGGMKSVDNLAIVMNKNIHQYEK